MKSKMNIYYNYINFLLKFNFSTLMNTHGARESVDFEWPSQNFLCL